jgi:hypothetical protein
MATNNGTTSDDTLGFKPINLFMGAGAAAAIGLGYLLLAQGSITLAPVLLIVGYVVLVPLAFLL